VEEIRIPLQVLKDKRLIPAAKAVFGVIYSHASESAGGRLTQPQIAVMTGYSLQQVKSAVKQLEDVGYLRVQRVGGRHPNHYVICLR